MSRIFKHYWTMQLENAGRCYPRNSRPLSCFLLAGFSDAGERGQGGRSSFATGAGIEGVISRVISRVFKRSQTGFIPSAILYISFYAFTSFLSTNWSISWWTNAFNFSSLAEMHQLNSWERQKRLAPWRKNAKLTWTRHHRRCRG